MKLQGSRRGRGPLTVYGGEYGFFFVMVPCAKDLATVKWKKNEYPGREYDCSPGNLMKIGYSKTFVEIMRLASKKRCEWIMFCEDREIYAELPIFLWEEELTKVYGQTWLMEFNTFWRAWRKNAPISSRENGERMRQRNLHS